MYINADMGLTSMYTKFGKEKWPEVMFWWHGACNLPELLVTELVTGLFLALLHIICYFMVPLWLWVYYWCKYDRRSVHKKLNSVMIVILLVGTWRCKFVACDLLMNCY